MDAQIWKDIPEELLEVVIAKLPIEVFFRFRLVCRKWNSSLQSPSFMQHCAEVTPPNNPWLFVIPNIIVNTHSFYNIDMKKWYHQCGIPSVIPNVAVASARGLVCQADYRAKIFYVGNPLTKTWKEFPWFFKPGRSIGGADVVAMIYNSTELDGSYKIVSLENDGDYKVIDPLENSMPNPSPTNPKRVPVNITLPMFLVQGTVTIGSVIYFLRSRPNGILSYDVLRDTWEQMLVATPPNSTNIALAECDGRILLVGFVRDRYEASISVHVWELERTTLVWVEVDRMPNVLCSEVKTGRFDVFFKCLANKRVLVMTLFTSRMCRMFTYDAMSRVWSMVPRCVPPAVTSRVKIINGIGFFPSLSASP